jgi:hypothetical protein
VVDGEIGDELLSPLSKPTGSSVWAGTDPVSAPSTTRNAPSAVHGGSGRVEVPGDAESRVFVDMVDALGASATPMAYGEVYTALSTGVIDGAENNYPSFYTSNHYEVAGYYTQDEHLRVPEIILMSKKVPTTNSECRGSGARSMRAAAESVPYQRQLSGT